MTMPPGEKKTKDTPVKEEIPGYKVKVVYNPEDIEDLHISREVGEPGEFPFTRGVSPAMYRGKLWTMRVSTYSGLGEEINARIKFLRRHGDIEPSLAFDLPTRLGLDSDDPKARGEVARLGVAVDTLDDMESIFNDIPLDKIDVSFPISAPANIVLAMYFALAEKRGVPLADLKGVVENDGLQEHISYGTSVFPIEMSIRLVGDAVEYCLKNTPNFKPVDVSYWRPSGLARSEALGHMFLKAIAYCDEMLGRGYSIDDLAPMISFQYTPDENIVESVAALRGAREAWAKIMKERFGAKKPESMMLRVEAYVNPASLKVEEELRFNITRVACQVLTSVIGGVQGLVTPTYDEVVGPPSELGIRVAARTQQVIAYELEDLTNVVDPFGGAYFVEKLTSDMSNAIHNMVKSADGKKSVVSIIESARYRREEAEKAVPKFNPDLHSAQIDRLGKVKKERDGAAVKQVLTQVRQAAAQKKNVIPPLVQAAKAYATMGEMVQALKG